MNKFYVFLIFKFFTVRLRAMPDESCRGCGGNLLDFSQCAECKQVISLICKSCHRKTMEQYHSQCLLAEPEFGNSNTPLLDNISSFALA